MKYTLHSLAGCLLLGLVQQAAAQTKIKTTPWQIHEGNDGLIKFATPTDKEKQAALDKATLPSQTDRGWTVAPAKDGVVDFDRPSRIPQFQGFKQLDFLYFQTVVTIPPGTEVKTFQVEFDSVDDGARVYIFNSKNPDGFSNKAHDIIKASQKAKVDFSGHAVAGENRIVVAQYDLCDPGNTIRGIRIIVDGSEVTPPVSATRTTQESKPFESVSHGDVHVRTPDGLVYDFQGTGEFLCSISDDKKAIVQTRQEMWHKNPKVSINTAAAILADGQKFEFYLKPRFRWFMNDKEQDAPGENGGGARGLPGGARLDYRVLSPGNIEYIIYWSDKSFAARVFVVTGSHLDVGIRRDSDAHAYQGFFGNLDMNAMNDMTLRDGSMVTPPADIAGINKFTDSWRLQPGESLFSDVKNAQDAALAKNPHTDVQIPKDKWDSAEKEVKAAGITSPLAARNTTYDVALTGEKSFIETGKIQDAARKALPPGERAVVAGDKANQAAVEAENKAAAAAGSALKDQVTASAAAGKATWAGSWSWAADDTQREDHSKLIMKSETDFVYTYAGQSYNLKGKIGHSGGVPTAPLCVNLDLPNGDHLRFEWKSPDEVEGHFWKKGKKAGITKNNPPETTAELMRVK